MARIDISMYIAAPPDRCFDLARSIELHTRSTKARFDGAFWTEHSRNLVERWQGEGVDPELVDLEILREVWKSTSPDARSFSLLQAVWLAREERRGRESGRDAVEQELDSLV